MCMSSLHTCALGVKNDAATYDLLMRFSYAIFNKGKNHPFVANKKMYTSSFNRNQNASLFAIE